MLGRTIHKLLKLRLEIPKYLRFETPTVIAPYREVLDNRVSVGIEESAIQRVFLLSVS